ncbi:MAG TPA: hypothetical protein VGN41_04065, partial [Streptosporangiaceae bacterium]
HFDRVLYDGGEFGTATAAGSPEEEDFLGLPGLLEPAQVAELLRKRQSEQLRARSRGVAGAGGASGPEPGLPAGPGATVIGFGARGAGAEAADAQGPAAPAGTAGAGRLGAGGAAGEAGVADGAPAADGAAETGVPPVSREALAALRKELNGLVAAWNHRTGQPHGVIHNDLRRACGGPPLPQATAAQIRARIDMIRHWAATRR